MPGTPKYLYPDTPSDYAGRQRAMDNFVDFGATGAVDFEEQDQRDVDSYANFSYAPGWFDRNAPGGSFWDQQWGTERQTEGLLENTQRHVQEQATLNRRQAQNLQDNMRMDNQGQLQNQVPANAPVRPVAPRQHIPQTVTAPTAPNYNPPTVPQIPAALPSAPALPNPPNVPQAAAPTAPTYNPPTVPQIPAALPSAPALPNPSNVPQAAAPTAPTYNLPTVPQMPVALPSAPAQPVQLPAAPPAASRPTLPLGLPLPPAQRPLQPVGFNDQPRARMLPGSYLTPHQGTPRRNVQWPENIEISLVEIATFCPNWFQNPEVVGRAIRNGWTRENIAKAQLLAEDPASRDSYKTRSGRIQKQVSAAHRMIEDQLDLPRSNANAFRNHHGLQNDLTANAWQFKHHYDPDRNAPEHLGDMPLSAFYGHVRTWPTGNDRLLMTQCLEFAFQNPGRQLDSSHWNWIITSQGFATPPPLANGQNRDIEALERLGRLPNPL